MEQRNLIIAIAVSVAILIGSQAIMAVFFPPKPVTTTEQTASTGAPSAPSSSAAPSAPAAVTEQPLADRNQVIAAAARIAVHSPRLTGSIDLKGGRLDDLVLNDYHETVDPTSPNIVLLSPVGAANAYYADFGWVAQEPGVALPTADTVWQVQGDQLAPGHPVTLTWDNGQGLKFERRFELDDNFMFKVTQRVENGSGQTVTLFPYGLIARHGTPHLLNYYILHEGLLGVLDGKLIDNISYKDIREKKQINYDQRPLQPYAPRHDRSLSGRLSRRRNALGGGPVGRERDPALRRRQGRQPARQVRRSGWDSAVRPRGRFRLSLLPDQADLPGARFSIWAGGEFRRRHHAADGPDPPAALPARQQVL
jgi:hypothetical protein